MRKRMFGTVKTLIASALMIGTVAGSCLGATNLAVAVETDKIVTLPTSYPADVVTPPMGQNRLKTPESYVKPNYTLVDNDLEYYRNIKPTANDIMREAAAEIGTKALADVFGIDLNGKEIEMTYDPAEGKHRAQWTGSWWCNGKKNPDELYVASYWFQVDAISGELQVVGHNRVLPSNAGPSFDMNLLEGSKDYTALAEKSALEYGAIYNAVQAVEYSGQGSINNDLQVWFDLTGTDGERARIALSRYDKAVVQVDYNDAMKQMDEYLTGIEQEQVSQVIIEQRAKEYFKAHPDAKFYYDEELNTMSWNINNLD